MTTQTKKRGFSFPEKVITNLAAAEARAGAPSNSVLRTMPEPINSVEINMTKQDPNQIAHPLTMHKSVPVAHSFNGFPESKPTAPVQPSPNIPAERPDLSGYRSPADEPEVIDDTRTKIVEKVIVEKHKGGFGIGSIFRLIALPFKLLNGIRQIITTGCFLLIAAVVLLFVTLIFKPPILWNPFKAFLNADIAVPAKTTVALDVVYDKVAAEGVTDRRVRLNEQELMTLLGQSVQTGTDFRVDMETNQMRLLVNMEDSENPLWLVADLNSADGTTKITKIGFNRVGLPDGVNNFISDQLFRILDLTKQQLSGNPPLQVFSNALDTQKLPIGLTLKSVTYGKDEVIIDFNYDSSASF